MINFREQRVNCYHLLADMARFSCPRAAKNGGQSIHRRCVDLEKCFSPLAVGF